MLPIDLKLRHGAENDKFINVYFRRPCRHKLLEVIRTVGQGFGALGHVHLYKMKALSDALVHAVAYINCLPDPVEEHADADVHMLEDMATYLANSTEDERDALAAAAQRALEQEQNGAKRTDYIQVYSEWMECMFGDGWKGNQRV